MNVRRTKVLGASIGRNNIEIHRMNDMLVLSLFDRGNSNSDLIVWFYSTETQGFSKVVGKFQDFSSFSYLDGGKFSLKFVMTIRTQHLSLIIDLPSL